MKQFLYILFLGQAALLAGCHKLQADAMPANRTVTVEMFVRPDHMTVVTRTADEAALRDVNFYLCDKMGHLILHGYAATPTLRFECVPGDYRIYIAANMECDMGIPNNLQDLRINHAEDYEVLPMVYEGDVSISAVIDPVILPTVEVKRLVAKISYDIAVHPADIELISVQLSSVPRRSSIFKASAEPSGNPDDYMDCLTKPIFGREAVGSCYLLTNLQGQNTSIKTPQQKNRDNAPEHASCLQIRALKGNRVLTYTVFLGENTTSDFNVRANTHYTFDIAILGDNAVDTRISSYEVAVYDDFEDAAYGGYCPALKNRQLHLNVMCDGELPALQAEVTIVEGDPAALYLNGRTLNEPFIVDLTAGDNVLAMEYAPELFDASNCNLRYTVCVKDAFGFKRTTEITHKFANKLIANVWSGVVINGMGTIFVSEHLYDQEMNSATHARRILCNKGCTLTAQPAVGYTFEGWYADNRFMKPIASTSQYRYVATTNSGIIYAKFNRIDGTPLDSSATANCYLAPQLETWYSFNATTRGNSKQSPGLLQTTLNGVESRILWESGETAGTVLQDTFFRAGRIYIRTGTTWGNAVVGLFNAEGTCVWSWHIWAMIPRSRRNRSTAGRYSWIATSGLWATIGSVSKVRGFITSGGVKILSRIQRHTAVVF